MRRFWIATLLVVLLVGGGLSTAGALDRNTKGELTNWTWTFVCVDEWLVPAFNKLYPNIKITTTPMAFDETHDKIFTAIAAGSGAPDFATIVSDYVQKFIVQGGLVDMTDYLNKHKGEFPKLQAADELGLQRPHLRRPVQQRARGHVVPQGHLRQVQREAPRDLG